ncbi:MAG: Fic family protein [Rhodocyclaceae bacterium]|nr:Fic family protein [Rhodocyclaceae bacterium]
MPKKAATQELDQVHSLIARYPEGIGVDALLTQMSNNTSRRTLQRRLNNLVQDQRIVCIGKGPATRYVLAAVTAPYIAPEIATNHLIQSPRAAYLAHIPGITLSVEGIDIRAHISQPREKRTPVGYNMAFLESYYPNYTFYLPETLRTQLHSMGRSPTQQTQAGTFARDILSRLLIDLSWASSKLEGNTYSWLDTERLIAHGQAADDKDALETQMILNHKAAIEYLVHNSEQVGINPDTVIALHAMLADGLMTDPLTVGRLRNCPVGIGGSVYQPLTVPQSIEELFGIVLQMADEIEDPFEQSFFLMVHLPYLQPFEDVNKRVSRLAANIPLIRHNLCPLTFLDVPQQLYVDALLGVYELNRIELLRDVYFAAYHRSSQQYAATRREMAQPDTFRMRYRQALAEIIRNIIQENLPVNENTIRQHLPISVAETDRPRFMTLVQEEFKSLHAGNAIRFGVRPLVFEGWQGRTG